MCDLLRPASYGSAVSILLLLLSVYCVLPDKWAPCCMSPALPSRTQSTCLPLIIPVPAGNDKCRDPKCSQGKRQQICREVCLIPCFYGRSVPHGLG